MRASDRKARGVTDQSSPVVSTAEPSAVRASAIRMVSRERSAPRTSEGASAMEASTSARLVTDLLPGSDTSRSTGPVTAGAGHGSASRVVVTPEGYPRSLPAAESPQLRARQLPFDDQTFDVVVSSMALHNIPRAAGRAAAIDEIARVLKPGGRVAILDFRGTGQYAAVLAAAGLGEVHRSQRRFGMYPPVRVVTATKP